MSNKTNLLFLGLLVGLIVLGKNVKANSKLAWVTYSKYLNIKENDSRFYEILKEFWMYAGLTESKAKNFISSNYAWSSAFVSYIMVKSGFKDFPVSTSHTCFASKIKNGNYENYSLKRVNEYAPKIGDIVIKNRAGNNLTYDSFKCGDYSHSDIVVGVTENQLITIGGNVNNQISITDVSINSKGLINDDKYFAVVSVR